MFVVLFIYLCRRRFIKYLVLLVLEFVLKSATQLIIILLNM